MICYRCNGTGEYDIYNECPVCDGTGEYDPTDKGFGLPHDDVKLEKKWENTVWDTDAYLDDLDGKEPQTNEQWFCGLSTEEKAEWIAKQKCDGCHDEPYDEKYSVCKYCMEKKTEQVREWLKQPHINKE